MALTSRSQITFGGGVTEEPFNFFTEAPGQNATTGTLRPPTSSFQQASSFASSPSGQYVSRTTSANVTAPDNDGFQYFIPRNYPNDSPTQFRATTRADYDFDSQQFGMMASLYGPMVREALQTRPVRKVGGEYMTGVTVASGNANQNAQALAQVNFSVGIDQTLGEKQATFGTPEYFRKLYHDAQPDDPAADAQTLDFLYSRGGMSYINKLAANGSRPAQIAALGKAQAEGDYKYAGPTWAINPSRINAPLPHQQDLGMGGSTGTRYHTGSNGIAFVESARPGGYLFDRQGGEYGSSYSIGSTWSGGYTNPFRGFGGF